MRAAFCSTIENIEIRTIPTPSIGPGEALLRVSACGLCGTDIKKLQGEGLDPARVLGHEIVGTIESLGDGVADFRVGDRVVVSHHVPCFTCHYCQRGSFSMCRAFKASNVDPGGYAEFLRVPTSHVKAAMFKLPTGLDEKKAIFTEPLACCVRGLRRLSITTGDTVVLIGFGSIGMLMGELLRLRQVRVLAVDLDEARIKRARSFDFIGVHPVKEDLHQLVRDWTEGRGADAVIFTAGAASTLQESLTYVRDGGEILLFSDLAGGESAVLDTHQIYKREITVRSSYSPGAADLAEAFRLIAEGKVSLETQQIDEFSLQNISKAIRDTLERRTMKALIRPQAA